MFKKILNYVDKMDLKFGVYFVISQIFVYIYTYFINKYNISGFDNLCMVLSASLGCRFIEFAFLYLKNKK